MKFHPKIVLIYARCESNLRAFQYKNLNFARLFARLTPVFLLKKRPSFARLLPKMSPSEELATLGRSSPMCITFRRSYPLILIQIFFKYPTYMFSGEAICDILSDNHSTAGRCHCPQCYSAYFSCQLRWCFNQNDQNQPKLTNINQNDQRQPKSTKMIQNQNQPKSTKIIKIKLFFCSHPRIDCHSTK